MKNILFFGIISTILFACNPTKKLITETVEYTDLDTMVITAPKPDALKTKEEFALPRYTPTARRTNDLVHTKLDLKFDWEMQRVIGIAELTLQPYFYPTAQVELDAKGFDINSIMMGSQKLDYDYDGNKLVINLGKEYNKGQKLSLIHISEPTRPY